MATTRRAYHNFKEGNLQRRVLCGHLGYFVPFAVDLAL